MVIRKEDKILIKSLYEAKGPHKGGLDSLITC